MGDLLSELFLGITPLGERHPTCAPNAAQVAFTNMRTSARRRGETGVRSVSFLLNCFCFAARTSVVRLSRAMLRRSRGQVEVRLEALMFS